MNKLELDDLTEKRLDESLIAMLKEMQEKRELAVFMTEMGGQGKVSRCDLGRVKGMEDLLFFMSRLTHMAAMDLIGQNPSLKETPFAQVTVQMTYVLAYLGDRRCRATLAESLNLRPIATISAIRKEI